jgi:NAD-dependent dihydropyrimidine dehydrogenase PreA subunit
MDQKTGGTPLGSKRNLPDFTRERCKQCGICVHFCPKGALTLDAQNNPVLTDPEACNACRLCEYLCPDFGVKVRRDGEDERDREDERDGEGEENPKGEGGPESH